MLDFRRRSIGGCWINRWRPTINALLVDASRGNLESSCRAIPTHNWWLPLPCRIEEYCHLAKRRAILSGSFESRLSRDSADNKTAIAMVNPPMHSSPTRLIFSSAFLHHRSDTRSKGPESRWFGWYFGLFWRSGRPPLLVYSLSMTSRIIKAVKRNVQGNMSILMVNSGAFVRNRIFTNDIPQSLSKGRQAPPTHFQANDMTLSGTQRHVSQAYFDIWVASIPN